MDEQSTPTIVVGIDIGALTTKITLGPKYDHELVRNSQGGHVMPTAVTFPQGNHRRLIGEDAAEISRADGNTVTMLDRLLIGSLKSGDTDEPDNNEEEDVLSAFRRFQVITSDDQSSPRVYIPNKDKEYSSTALMAMLLGNVKKNVIATIDRLDGSDGSSNACENLHFVFAVPPNYPQSTCDILLDSAYAASVPNSSVVTSPQCLAAVYQRKFGDVDIEQEKNILVIEMGHSRSCVSILKKIPIKERDEDDDVTGSKVELLSTVSSTTLGASLVDIALYHHFLATHPSLSHYKSDPESSLKPNSRTGQRLLEGCRKLKHQLSMLPENKVTVENIGKNDSDVNLSCTREILKQLCKESVADKLEGMIELAILKAGGAEYLGEVHTIEITGGGSRIPFVQETIRNVLKKGDDFVFARSLDDTSLAFGASLVGITSPTDMNGMDADREARRCQLLQDEVALSEQDVKLMKKDVIRNQIEAYILELRSARHSKHGSLLPSSEEFAELLDSTDDWLFSEECDAATLAQMEQKWTAIESKMKEMCADYFAAKQKEAEEKDREMDEEAKLGAALRDAEAAMNGDEEDDHDTRRLPTKRRMEIVMKNKNEANELFSDKNYRHAAARYAKALTHCTKFFDLSPEEEKEVQDVKLSLYLNIALAYIKLEKLDNALQNCNDALSLDESNVKALYRRASVFYQKRKFDDAVKDLTEAAKLAPEDKAVAKLRGLVDQQIAKQKKKEKAMAKKMFG